jgi:hypothetical protein
MEIDDLAVADALAILAEIEAMVPRRPPKRRRRQDVIAEAFAETTDPERNEKILGAMRAGSLPADAAKANGISPLAVRAIWGSKTLGLEHIECSAEALAAAKAATRAIRREIWLALHANDEEKMRDAAQARRDAMPPGVPGAGIRRRLSEAYRARRARMKAVATAEPEA